jgi:hypothetical protein
LKKKGTLRGQYEETEKPKKTNIHMSGKKLGNAKEKVPSAYDLMQKKKTKQSS